MATKNSIGNISNPLSSTAITVDPGASGDSYIQFDINTTGEFRVGVDDDDSDKFKMSQGSALGANDTFSMTANGERIMPLQPAFLAYLGTTDSNVTGDGTTYVLGSGNALTEIFDQGSDFVTTGTFTAPITGKFLLAVSIKVVGLTSAMTSSIAEIITSNRTYSGGFVNPGAIGAGGLQVIYQLNVLADMDASDTVTTQITVSNGPKSADIEGSATLLSYFSGVLIA